MENLLYCGGVSLYKHITYDAVFISEISTDTRLENGVFSDTPFPSLFENTPNIITSHTHGSARVNKGLNFRYVS